MIERVAYWIAYLGSAIFVALVAAVLTSPRLQSDPTPYWLSSGSQECAIDGGSTGMYVAGPEGIVVCVRVEEEPPSK